jgi:hypothetical protein
MASSSAPSAEALVGTWRYVSAIDTKADGTPVSVLPAVAYEGLLIYTDHHYVSVTLMPKGRDWSNAAVTDAQLRAAVLAPATTAYAGTYQFDKEARTVTHHIETSLDPSDEGRDLVRSYTLVGNTLKLSGQWQEHGEMLRFTVTFERVD